MKCEVCKKELIKFGDIFLHPPHTGSVICQEKDGISIVIEDEALHKIFQDKYKKEQKRWWKWDNN